MSWKKTKASTDALTKILTYLKMAEVPVIRTMIRKGTGLSGNVINDGLSWLCAHGLVKRVKKLHINKRYNHDIWFYTLNTKKFK